MKVLVAVATRHGATREIAEQLATSIGTALTGAGVPNDVVIKDAGLLGSSSGFDALVVGSAVYWGRWLDSAEKLARSGAADRHPVPMWLFSSGPGDGEATGGQPADAAALLAATGAREHRLFSGPAGRQALLFPERVAVLRGEDGDHRDWPSIRAWGREIGAHLARTRSTIEGRALS